MNICNTFLGNSSISCGDISIKNTNVNLKVVLEVKTADTQQSNIYVLSCHVSGHLKIKSPIHVFSVKLGVSSHLTRNQGFHSSTTLILFLRVNDRV